VKVPVDDSDAEKLAEGVGGGVIVSVIDELCVHEILETEMLDSVAEIVRAESVQEAVSVPLCELVNVAEGLDSEREGLEAEVIVVESDKEMLLLKVAFDTVGRVRVLVIVSVPDSEKL
jgi:hypothetical protein